MSHEKIVSEVRKESEVSTHVVERGTIEVNIPGIFNTAEQFDVFYGSLDLSKVYISEETVRYFYEELSDGEKSKFNWPKGMSPEEDDKSVRMRRPF